MTFSLDIKSFAFFKVVFGTVFLLIAVIFREPLALIFTIIPLVVGKAHTMGAWLAMWKSNKLNWKYVSFVTFYVAFFFWFGLIFLSLNWLIIITYTLFAFHFLFDEFDLQEQKRSLFYFITPIFIFVQLVLYMFTSYYPQNISFNFYLALSIIPLLVEFLYLKEINWFYINIKILSLFVLYCVYFNVDSIYLFSTILMFHYMFWFIYPVYKVHKYKREDRDGFIMILIILILTSIYFAASKNYQPQSETYEYAVRYFSIFTIIHILATAPFGYWIGLPRPKYHT